VGRRCLLILTSRPFRAARDVAPAYRHLFKRHERSGWTLRATGPRNFVCWRRSALITGSGLRVAVFPDDGFGLSGEEKAALCLLELLRRLTRIDLLARGFPPRLADEAPIAVGLREAAARRLAGACCPAHARRLVAELESKIGEAVTRGP
jgi:hypothetical protein